MTANYDRSVTGERREERQVFISVPPRCPPAAREEVRRAGQTGVK